MLAELRRMLADGSRPPVVWLQGQTCTGCSVSLLNSIYNAAVDSVLLNTIDLKYHPTVMAAAGDLAVSAAESTHVSGGYVLVVEGAIPAGLNGDFCQIWENMTMQQAVQSFATNAAYILAVGTCASFGGIPKAAPNPTAAQSVQQVIGASPKLVNLPGCPVHPDWVVGAIAYILANGGPPPLDQYKRPLLYYGNTVHNECVFNGLRYCDEAVAHEFGELGCVESLGCKGRSTRSDCPVRKWNSRTAGKFGDSWCVGSGCPCIGCTEYNFPDGMSPFYEQ
jgi:hydrogenase small subunit